MGYTFPTVRRKLALPANSPQIGVFTNSTVNPLTA
jgi:hypothetical protein